MARGSLGFMQLAIIAGYSMFYALYLITFFGFFLTFPHDYGFALGHSGQVAYFIGTIAASAAILLRFRRRNSSELTNGRMYIWAVALLAIPLPCCVIADYIGARLPAPVFLLACLIAGLHVAAAFMYWDDLCKRGYIKQNMRVRSTIFAIGGCIFLASIFMFEPLVLGFFCIIVSLLSMGLLAFIDGRAEKTGDFPIESAVKTFTAMHHLDIVCCMLTMAFGFAFMLFYHDYGMTILVAMGAAIVLDFVLSSIVGQSNVVPFVGSLRICVSFSSIALIGYLVPDSKVKIVSLGIVVAFWFLYRSVNACSLMELAARRKISVQYAVGRGKLASNTGFCIGLAIGIAVTESADYAAATNYTAMAIVAAIILCSMLLLPFDSESDVPGLRTLLPIKSSRMQSTERKSRAQQCSRVTAHYKLSPREDEVLALIAEGRNAKHVAERLFISESTAKTHIANIYRKVNVHSQQELLDILDHM